ncbi:hypothetical protein NK6_2513 [Bradyrhizobium diazoefficiens]|jgi:hypothetical protein|uniref:Uncharacterized protein n=1 Tax=Bradyrhizobium diazoefficiens TaxID=1355477 RepID=A0A0E4BN27_9BRAD|nr:hypothetical protein NK6_2513 [Bradyrhizobium diazoefficiens]
MAGTAGWRSLESLETVGGENEDVVIVASTRSLR